VHFAAQAPSAIDAGVFHNDVIAVGNREVLLFHQRAFIDSAAITKWARSKLSDFCAVEVLESEVSMEDAVGSYLFNSQLVCLPRADGLRSGQVLICSQECRDNPRVWQAILRIIGDPENPIEDVRVFDLQQSMRNGGGPACLRLRVVMNEAERAATNPKIWLDDALHSRLSTWASKHYRDHLIARDLADPHLLDESRHALDELTQILGLGSLYEFQR
jgi:succinylarginine dihydrolase